MQPPVPILETITSTQALVQFFFILLTNTYPSWGVSIFARSICLIIYCMPPALRCITSVNGVLAGRQALLTTGMESDGGLWTQGHLSQTEQVEFTQLWADCLHSWAPFQPLRNALTFGFPKAPKLWKLTNAHGCKSAHVQTSEHDDITFCMCCREVRRSFCQLLPFDDQRQHQLCTKSLNQRLLKLSLCTFKKVALCSLRDTRQQSFL